MSASSSSRRSLSVLLLTVLLAASSSAPAYADYCTENAVSFRYGGGPLQTSTTVYTLFIGNSFPQPTMDQTNSFLKTLVSDDSPYFDWLCEYNTATQRFQTPKFGGSARNPNTLFGTALTLTALRDIVASHIIAGDFPIPSGNGLNATFVVFLGDHITFSDPAVGNTCNLGTTGFCTEHTVVPFAGDVNAPQVGQPNLYIGIVPDLSLCSCDGVDIRPKAARVLINTITNPTQTYRRRDASVLNGWTDVCRHDISDVIRCHDTGVLTMNSGQNLSILVPYGWSNQKAKCVGQVNPPMCGPFEYSVYSAAPHLQAPMLLFTVMSLLLSVFHVAF